jgi:hypothetical protein
MKPSENAPAPHVEDLSDVCVRFGAQRRDRQQHTVEDVRIQVQRLRREIFRPGFGAAMLRLWIDGRPRGTTGTQGPAAPRAG